MNRTVYELGNSKFKVCIFPYIGRILSAKLYGRKAVNIETHVPSLIPYLKGDTFESYSTRCGIVYSFTTFHTPSENYEVHARVLDSFLTEFR